MKRYYILDVKTGMAEGGMACGPVPGTIFSAVKYSDGRELKWLYLAEAMGFPNFYLTDEDVFDQLEEEDIEDTDFTEFLNDHFLETFEGISVSIDYDEVLASYKHDSDNPAVPLIRYMIALCRCPEENLEALKKAGKGHYVDEIDIPKTDLEEDYEFENEC